MISTDGERYDDTTKRAFTINSGSVRGWGARQGERKVRAQPDRGERGGGKSGKQTAR